MSDCIPLLLPRVCLVQVLHSILSTPIHDSSIQDPVLLTILKSLSHYGTISSLFRSAVLDSVFLFLNTSVPVFDYRKYSSHLRFLHKLFPSFSFSIKIITSPDLVLPSFLIKQLFVEPPKSVNQITAEDAKALLSIHLVSSLQSLGLSKFTLNQSLFTLLVSCCPLLRDLTLDSCIFPGSVFVLPSCLVQLTTLTMVVSLENEGERTNAFDVSNLLKIENLNVRGLNGSTIMGLAQLSSLQNLALRSVSVTEGLHPSVRLITLQLDFIRAKSSELLFSNIDVIQKCKISIGNCINIPVSVQLLLKPRLFSFSQLLRTSEAIEFWRNLTFVEYLHVYFGNSLSIELSMCFRISRLTISAYSNCKYELTLPPILYLLRLDLLRGNWNTFCKLIKSCPFLEYLVVGGVHTVNSLTSLENLSLKIKLNYLKCLKISGFHEFLDGLPVLPRLCSMSLDTMSGLDLSRFNSQFPVLSYLKLQKCPLLNAPTQPNVTITRLTLIDSLSNTSHPDCLSHFLRLIVLNITFTSGGNSSPAQIVIPPCLRYLYCSGLYGQFSCTLKSLPRSLLVLSGRLFTTEKDLKEVEEVVSQLISRGTLITLQYSSQ
ncbi:hypothetical protein RCL1_008649 [Eukaryota sp. TZLM3-RCL]